MTENGNPFATADYGVARQLVGMKYGMGTFEWVEEARSYNTLGQMTGMTYREVNWLSLLLPVLLGNHRPRLGAGHRAQAILPAISAANCCQMASRSLAA